MKRLPAASSAIPVVTPNSAFTAGPPSPLKPYVDVVSEDSEAFPATVEMMPVDELTFRYDEDGMLKNV